MQASGAPPSPPCEPMRRLASLVGIFDLTITVPGRPEVQQGLLRVNKVLNDAFLLMHATGTNIDGTPHESQVYYGVDHDTQKLSRVRFGRDGGFGSTLSEGWDGDTIAWRGHAYHVTLHMQDASHFVMTMQRKAGAALELIEKINCVRRTGEQQGAFGLQSLAFLHGRWRVRSRYITGDPPKNSPTHQDFVAAPYVNGTWQQLVSRVELQDGERLEFVTLHGYEAAHKRFIRFRLEKNGLLAQTTSPGWGEGLAAHVNQLVWEGSVVNTQSGRQERRITTYTKEGDQKFVITEALLAADGLRVLFALDCTKTSEHSTLQGPMEPFGRLMGTWRRVHEVRDALTGRTYTTRARMVVEPGMQGKWLHGYAEGESEGHTYAAEVREGFDPTLQRYTRMLLMNSGAWGRATSSGWQNDTLQWDGELRNFRGRACVPHRIVVSCTGQDTYTEVNEILVDEAWQSLMVATATRAPCI